MYSPPIDSRISIMEILLVEDDREDAKIVQIALSNSERSKFKVDIADTLSSAIGLVNQQNYDLVLLDLGLPDSLGLETFEKFSVSSKNIPIIVLSGLADEEVAINAVSQGAQDYLIKGPNIDEILVRSINYAIERNKLLIQAKTTLQTLGESREQFKALVEATSNFVIICLNGKIVYANPSFIKATNFLSEDIKTGKISLKSVIDPEFYQQCELGISEALLKNQPVFSELKIVTKEGKNYEVLTENKLIQYQGQSAVQMVMTDVGYFKELQRMKDSFLSIASHELKTPLTSIDGYSKTILSGKAGKINDTQKRFLQIITGETERLTKLVTDLLDYSRIKKTWKPDQLESVNFTEIVPFVIETLKPMFDEKNIKIKLIFPKDERKIFVNIDGIKQVLLNIIGNALKFTPSGGVIKVVVEDRVTKKTISIEDTGIGIAPDMIEKIFEPFMKTDKENIGFPKGTGLGLTIAQQIIKFHNGEITVKSDLGVGTKFTCSFPLQN